MNNFLNLAIKNFQDLGLFGAIGASILFLFSLGILLRVLYSLYRFLFIKVWYSGIKVVQAKVVSLSYKANSKKSAKNGRSPVSKIAGVALFSTKDEFNVILRSDRFKRLVIQNEQLFDSIEDGDAFTLEYKEKYEHFIFQSGKKIFIQFIPVRATLKTGEVISLSI